MRRVGIGFGAALGLVTLVKQAHAREEARVRLRYERSPAAAACADEPGMRDAVAARLGYDPFVDDAPEGVSIALDRRVGVWQARIALEDAAHTQTGARTLTSHETSCDELVSTISLAVGLAIDPLQFSPPAAPPARASEPPPPPPPPPSPVSDARSLDHARAPIPSRARFVAFTSVGGFVTAGVVPSVSFGPRLRAGLARQSWSIALEGLYVAPGAEGSASGRVEASVLAGGLLPCLRMGPESVVFEACARVLLGGLRGEAARVAISTPTTDPYLAAGAEIAAEIPLGERVGARVSAEFLTTITRTFLRIRDGGREIDVWSSPPISAGGGAELVVHFP